jgi:hypothetical protein
MLSLGSRHLFPVLRSLGRIVVGPNAALQRQQSLQQMPWEIRRHISEYRNLIRPSDHISRELLSKVAHECVHQALGMLRLSLFSIALLQLIEISTALFFLQFLRYNLHIVYYML